MEYHIAQLGFSLSNQAHVNSFNLIPIQLDCVIMVVSISDNNYLASMGALTINSILVLCWSKSGATTSSINSLTEEDSTSQRMCWLL